MPGRRHEETDRARGLAPNTFDFGHTSDNQSSVSVGPERAGTMVEKAPGGEPALEKSRREPSSLVLAILAAGIVLIGIIFTGVYAYHRLLRTPEEVANQLARDF